jgi:hypothetical protein
MLVPFRCLVFNCLLARVLLQAMCTIPLLLPRGAVAVWVLQRRCGPWRTATCSVPDRRAGANASGPRARAWASRGRLWCLWPNVLTAGPSRLGKVAGGGDARPQAAQAAGFRGSPCGPHACAPEAAEGEQESGSWPSRATYSSTRQEAEQRGDEQASAARQQASFYVLHCDQRGSFGSVLLVRQGQPGPWHVGRAVQRLGGRAQNSRPSAPVVDW